MIKFLQMQYSSMYMPILIWWKFVYKSHARECSFSLKYKHSLWWYPDTARIQCCLWQDQKRCNNWDIHYRASPKSVPWNKKLIKNISYHLFSNIIIVCVSPISSPSYTLYFITIDHLIAEIWSIHLFMYWSTHPYDRKWPEVFLTCLGKFAIIF